MMSKLFPPEILNSSAENYFSEQNTSSRIIYVFVLLFLIVAFSLLPFVNVQVSTQSEGVVRSADEENPIIPVVCGEVIFCRIIENQIVNKDDTLLTIATDRIDQDIRLLAFRQVEESLNLSDLNNLAAGNNLDLNSALYKQDYIAYNSKLDEQTTLVVQAGSDYIIAETLYNKGITPKHDFEKIAHQFQYEKNRYSSIQAQQFTLWHEKLQATILSLAELTVRIAQLKKEKEQYCIKAPISGTIIGYTGIKPGNFIYPNQQIARIAPETNLLVECFVTPADIGLIEKGMLASFQFHAFNYNLWGVATGKVNEISNNVITFNNRPFFRIKCHLDQDYLKLKNGYKGNLKKGMTLVGRFKVADRTLFQLLYDKTDNWLNPKLKDL